jgi:hypothetical protein
MTDKLFHNKELIQKVWEKGLIIEGLDENTYRKDHCGAIIKRDMFIKSSEFLSMCWVIDRIKPLEYAGTDELSNLQPLQWENKKNKGNNYPAWSCFVTSEDAKNKYH